MSLIKTTYLVDAIYNVGKQLLPLAIRRPLVRLIPHKIIREMQLRGTLKVTGETTKAKARRNKEGFFELYCQKRGLDVGYGGDLLTPNCVGWDFEQGDAQYLFGINDEEYNFVYSSHTLEHMANPGVTLRNWWRVIKPGGYLIIYIPHRDLYEKKTRLPSKWNPDHKYFFLLDEDDRPDTLGILQLIKDTLVDCKIIYAKICDEGHTIKAHDMQSDGEYSIEVVMRKRERG